MLEVPVVVSKDRSGTAVLGMAKTVRNLAAKSLCDWGTCTQLLPPHRSFSALRGAATMLPGAGNGSISGASQRQGSMHLPARLMLMTDTLVLSHFTQDPSFKAHFCVVKRRFMGSINGWSCDLGSRAPAHTVSEPALWQPSHLLSSIATLALKMS